MVLLDTKPIFYNEALIKSQAQDCPNVFNLLVAIRTEFALIKYFVLQFVNLILLWQYTLSTVVTFLTKYLSNNEHTGRFGGSDSGGLCGY